MTGSVSSILKRLFRDEARFSAAHGNGHQVFLDLFGGAGGIAGPMRRAGHGCLVFDINRGAHFDLTSPTIFNIVCGWMRGKCINGIFLGTPCTTFSMARRGPLGRGDGPLRTGLFPYGVPNLSPLDRAKVDYRNKLALQSIKLINCARRHQVLAALENPGASRLFRFPPFARLLKSKDACSLMFDMCSFGTRWRKRTRIVSWGFTCDLPSARLCQGKKGFCSFSDKRHIELMGRDTLSKTLWTSLAQTYPTPLCRDVASCLASASNNAGLCAMARRLCGL